MYILYLYYKHNYIYCFYNIIVYIDNIKTIHYYIQSINNEYCKNY